MKYAVVLTALAVDQIDEAFQWLFEQTPQHALEWFAGLHHAINSLDENPVRCPLLPEEEDPSQQARQMLFGDKWHAYRIIFDVREQTVTILQIRHAARSR